MKHDLHYRVVYSWAGIRSGRSTSPYTTFADANRDAMKLASLGKGAKVYAFARDPFNGDLVAEYAAGEHGAVCIPVVST